jgi:hypothetical protein
MDLPQSTGSQPEHPICYKSAKRLKSNFQGVAQQGATYGRDSSSQAFGVRGINGNFAQAAAWGGTTA